MTEPGSLPTVRPPSWGEPLTENDYAGLLSSWISREVADQAMLRRVNSPAGREVVGHKGSAECAGILIPYYWPGAAQPVNYRIRLDSPPWTAGKDGKPKVDKKYLGAPTSGNRIYVPPGIVLEQLADAKIAIVIVEGEKKALALWRLANYNSAIPRFLPVAVAGVWSWRGVVGKTSGPNGERLDVKGPIADLSRITWKGRTAFILYDANVHSNEHVKRARKSLARELATRGADVKLVNLPEDCGVNGVDDLLPIWGPDRVLELFEKAISGNRLDVVIPPQFDVRPDGMFRMSTRGGQLSQVQLANYRAEITANIQLDDGVDVSREFEVKSELLGRPFQFHVSASEFAQMDWPIEKMGAAAITYPNQREYARTAIQSVSLTAVDRSIYTHTGWRHAAGSWTYLHAGGAIGGCGAVPDVSVRLCGPLSRYMLDPGGLEVAPEAVKASLRLTELGSPASSFPLLAATCRAVFGNADFSLHLAGETGAYKSEIAALLQQHFGAGMDRIHLPGSWSSTGNSLESLAFQAKDAVFVIDDFAPQGGQVDVARYHATAERVFRAVGNRAARGRLDSTTRLREPKPPRALIISTGEDVPRGHSVRARLLVLELAKGSVRSAELTACQADARGGLYAQAMAAFVQWIARSYEGVLTRFGIRVAELRKAAHSDGAHARTPEIIASLQAAFEIYLEFGVECGALELSEKDKLLRRCWDALGQAALDQAKHQLATEPTAMFLAVLHSLLTSGRAHLASRDGTAPVRAAGCGWRRESHGWAPRGECMGWIEGDDVYLESTTSFRLVKESGRESGESLAVSEQILRKRLHEKGLLASVDRSRGTLLVRRNILGTARSVLHLSRGVIHLEDPELGDMDESGEM